MEPRAATAAMLAPVELSLVAGFGSSPALARWIPVVTLRWARGPSIPAPLRRRLAARLARTSDSRLPRPADVTEH